MAAIDSKRTIGSSEVFRLLERPQYNRGCARELAYEKLGYEPDYPPNPDDPILKRGNRLEPIASEIYAELTGRVLMRTRTRFHHKFYWARASTDRMIRSGPFDDEGRHSPTGDLEIKTRGEGPYRRVLRQGAFPGDELQIQWSMWVSGHKWGSLAILGVFNELPMLWWDREPDKELHEIFSWEGAKFAETVFRRGELPEPTFPATDPRCKVCPYRLKCRGQEADAEDFEAQRQVDKSGRQLFQIDQPTLTTTLWDIEELKHEKDVLEESIAVAKDKAIEQLGEGVEGAWVRGFGKVLHYQVRAHYLDSKQIKRDLPDVFDRYAKQRISYQFRTYPQGVKDGNSNNSE